MMKAVHRVNNNTVRLSDMVLNGCNLTGYYREIKSTDILNILELDNEIYYSNMAMGTYY